MRGSLPLLVSVVLAGGCRSLLGIDEATVADASYPDAPIDVPADALDCYGTGAFTICLDAKSLGPLDFASASTINTDSSECPTLRTAGTTWCVFPATDIVVSAKIRAMGSRPLVLLATGTLTISTTGGVDVGSRHSTLPGAGATGNSCPLSTAGSGAGGGAGGSFGTKGGNGGGALGVGGGMSGNPVGAINLLRGGCPGTRGGAGSSGNDTPGDAGGAVYLLAGTALDLQGQINASGGGSSPGYAANGGGGGGGSGGLILLWSPTVGLSPFAQVFANGGGGGGGSDGVDDGGLGLESPNPLTAAQGGRAAGSGPGTGGDGSLGSSPGQLGGSSSNGPGAGGGGGGAGIIRVLSGQVVTGSNVSPPPLP